MYKGVVKRVLSSAIFGTLLLGLALTGCAPQASGESPASTEAVAATEAIAATQAPAAAGPKVGGNLVYGLWANPDTLDTQKTNFGVMDAVMSRVGASLVAMDVNGKIIPYLAESWETSSDGLTWTFHLKQGVKFHNGDPVTAQDWVYTIQRMQDPATTSPTAGMVEPITNVEAVDDNTLVMTLDKPFYPILDTLALSSYLGVLSKAAIDAAGTDYGTGEGGVVGAGPYRFKEWVQDEKIIIQRNPDFTWGPVYYEGCNTGPYYIDTIEFRIIPDYATSLAALDSGDLDFYDQIVSKDVAPLEGTGNYTVKSILAAGLTYLEFNLTRAPLDDELFRQAINYAIDRDTIIQVVYSGQAQKELSPLSPAMIGYDPVVEQSGLDYDPDKAKELFQQAGFTYDADGILQKDGVPVEFTLLTTSDETSVKVAQMLTAQFKAIGIGLQIQTMEWGSMAAQLSAGDFDMDIMSIGYSDADILYLVYHSASAFWNHINDPEADRLLDLTRTEVDPAKHQEAINAATAYLMQHAYMAPIITPMSFAVVTNDITGYEYTAYTGITLADTYFTNLP